MSLPLPARAFLVVLILWLVVVGLAISNHDTSGINYAYYCQQIGVPYIKFSSLFIIGLAVLLLKDLNEIIIVSIAAGLMSVGVFFFTVGSYYVVSACPLPFLGLP